MSNHRYNPGIGNVGSYQTSARPYLTASLTVPSSSATPYEVSFGSVSRFVIITNTLDGGATNVPMRFGFSANGVKGTENNNYGVLNNGETFEAEFKVSRVYLLSDSATSEASASVIAGLTGIGGYHLSGNWSGSAGVG
jgi:hypothetical protein